MDSNFDAGGHKSVGGCPVWKKKADESCTLNLEVYEEQSSDGGSSEALEIVTSENEVVESSGRDKRRKRKNTSFYKNVPEILNSVEEEIEKQLDAKAAKSNLTVANVKNILKHVITNEHVLAMVRRTIKDEVGCGVHDDETEEECPYEPKLTRAKTKELLMAQPTISWPITPVKKQSPSKCHVLIEQELSEDSSDEEYQPNDEEQEQSEEEKETNTQLSAVEVQPRIAALSDTLKVKASSDSATQTSWSDDGLFKIPQESIGQRTRSKLSLSDTPLETIEKAFVPPDITTDMYDSECDDEDWKDFLKNFTEPLTTDVNDTFDDDEADPEYNVLADEEKETVDKEELRVDRAVKVSRKELNLLVAELLDCTDLMSSDDEDIRTQQQECPLPSKEEEHLPVEELVPVMEVKVAMATSVHSVQEEILSLSAEQRLLLDQQLRKHVQLTTQHFLLTHAHPQLSHYAAECHGIIVSLTCLAGSMAGSAFNAANLPAALKLIEAWKKRLDPSSPESSEIIGFVQKEIDMAMMLRKKRRVYNCRFPPQLLEAVSQSDVFLYPLLLPPQPFRCDGFAKPFYFPSEDLLLAIGLEQFEEYVTSRSRPLFQNSKRIKKDLLLEVMKLISAYMMPCKDPKQLFCHVRKARWINSNPVQYYYQHNRAPKTDHYVIPFTPDLVRPPSRQPKELLPEIWREYVYPDGTKSNDATSLLLLHS